MGNCVADPKPRQPKNRKKQFKQPPKVSNSVPKDLFKSVKETPVYKPSDKKPVEPIIKRSDVQSTEDDNNYVPPALPEGPCNVSTNHSMF